MPNAIAMANALWQILSALAMLAFLGSTVQTVPAKFCVRLKEAAFLMQQKRLTFANATDTGETTLVVAVKFQFVVI